MASALRQLQLEDVGEAIEEQSADEARQVLRWLSNLPSAAMPIDEWLESGTPQEAAVKAGSLSQLVRSLIRKIKRARRQRPDILKDTLVENAYHAAAAMAQAVIEYTLTRLPGHAKAAELEECISMLPPQASMRQAQSVARLAETVACGMEQASGKNITGKSVPERLVEASRRLQSTARKLRPVESLEPPAREESIELAREILRRLKNLGFSDKPLKEMIEAGRPEDKAAFAEAIDEMVDTYANLLLEAAETTPNLLQDQRVKEANEAMAAMVHGIKLMAAKEVPSSIAAAQQISADVTRSPEEWDRLHAHTVDRLLKSMEGGLEKAVGGIEAEQDRQAQEDDQQRQEMLDAAMQSIEHHGGRRKRKRRRRGRSGGGKKALKDKQAHEADDYVLKEGRFSRDTEKGRTPNLAPSIPGLTAEALAAVRQLGGTLLTLGRQAQEISATMATVSPTDKIAPDDKTVAQRVIEEQQRSARNQGLTGV